LRRVRTVNERLRWARKAAGYDTAADAARAFGWNEVTYTSHENGIRNPRPPTVQRYARALNVTFAWLQTGEGIKSAANPIPVVGYIGAGEMIFSVDDHAQGAGLDTAPRPPDVPHDDLVALRIRGDSMRPLREGWHVYYRRDADGVNEADCLNHLCVVRVDDGRTLLKELRRGYAPGRYNLHSWAAGADVIEDVVVIWAAPVLAVVM
jgi:transcriptional regulator with XRE-family HTH domain